MGTSTTTTFGPNGPQRTTTGGTIRPVTVRALEAQASRLERSQQRQQSDQQQAQATAFYRGQGEYSSLGAEGSYRPRGTVTSGGVPIGQAVPANNGLVGGMPAGSGDPANLAQTTERLATVAQERGPQIGDGDPNTLAIAPRYPQDHFYDSLTGTLWQWQATTDTDPGTWIVLCSAVESLPFRLDGQPDGTYVLDPSQEYPVEVVNLRGVSGATVTVSPEVGSVAAVGGDISITVSGSADGTPVLGKIVLRRVG